jgi:hypothetical protein
MTCVSFDFFARLALWFFSGEWSVSSGHEYLRHLLGDEWHVYRLNFAKSCALVLLPNARFICPHVDARRRLLHVWERGGGGFIIFRPTGCISEFLLLIGSAVAIA